jgi:DNA-binding NarL/FixJ family response regulator
MEHSFTAKHAHTVVLVDRHPLWLDAIKAVVRAAGLRVLSAFTSSERALEALPELQPGLVITDPDMPGGIAVIRAARAGLPDARVVALADAEGARQVEAAISAGAHAYIAKTAEPAQIRATIRQTALELDAAAESSAARETTAPRFPALPLTVREREILQLMESGCTTVEIARMLWLTERTVTLHVRDIRHKLRLTDDPERGSVPADDLAVEPRLQTAW